MLLRTASIADVWQYALAAKWSPAAGEYDLMVAEAMAGRVWCGVSAGGEIAALGGVLRVTRDLPGTCWLMVTPLASKRIVQTVLLARRVIRFEARACDGGLVCVVSDENPTGKRLATALGFVPSRETLGVLRNWRLQG